MSPGQPRKDASHSSPAPRFPRRLGVGGTLSASALTAVGVLLAGPCRAAAQFIDAALPRGGELRIQVSGSQSIYDRSHVPGRATEALGAPFSRALDAGVFSALNNADAAVASLLAALGAPAPSTSLSLGTAALNLQAEITEVGFDLMLGVTRWLAIGGDLPLVRARVFARPDLTEGSASAGPASTAFGTTPEIFVGQLRSAVAALNSIIESGAIDPARRAEAEALAARSQIYVDGFAALSAVPFLPTDSSEAGRGLQDIHRELAAGFESFGLVFPGLKLATPLDPAATFTLLADSLAMPPFGDADTGYRLGDAALKVFAQPLNTFRPLPVGQPEPAVRYRATLGFVRRFDTGSQDRADRAYDLPTGRGSPSVEFRGTLELALRRKLWLTVDAVLVQQEGHNLSRRVTPPDTPLVGPNREAEVTRDPGGVRILTAIPRLNLNESVSVGILLQREHRSRDRYEFAGEALAGIDADVLGEGSDASATRWGFEIRYRATGALGEARPGVPVETAFSYLKTTSGDGRVPAASVWRLGFRLYR